MKLFLREHLPLTIFFLVQVAITSLIYWLDNSHRSSTIWYAVLISFVLYGTYLTFRYMTHRKFYARLSTKLTHLDESIADYGDSPLSTELHELLQSQYSHFQNNTHSLKAKLDQHVTFINQWVHQMKTPVSVVHLILQKEDHPAFDSVQDEMDRIKKGLDTILYTARLETFSRDFKAETVPLAALVSSITSEQKRLFIRNRVFPNVDINPSIVVASDTKWLSFVLIQLVTNAVKYSAERSQKISIQAFHRGKQVALEIRDEGVGIPPQDLKRVFDPYFTGENGRKYQESTGMGLYLAKEICNQLNHRIELESKVDVGTTVRLIFQEDLGGTDSPASR